MFSPKRNTGAVFRFLRKMLGSCHSSRPKVISADKNAAYPPAFKAVKYFNLLDGFSKFRQKRYLNNIIEQDHRFIKKLVSRLVFGLNLHLQLGKLYKGTREAMHMIRKGQISKLDNNTIQNQTHFINSLFGVAV